MCGRAQYVAECFSNSSLFHKALKEAFESFCNKQVAGSSSAELMANFCDNLLKKARACGESCLLCKSACCTWAPTAGCKCVKALLLFFHECVLGPEVAYEMRHGSCTMCMLHRVWALGDACCTQSCSRTALATC